MTEQISTDWIKPGAEVVVYIKGGVGNHRPRPKTVQVARVAAKSFTLVGFADRFQLNTLSTKKVGDWNPWCYTVAKPGSEEADRVLNRERRRHVNELARVAVEKWQKNLTKDNRLAAIEALQKVED